MILLLTMLLSLFGTYGFAQKMDTTFARFEVITESAVTLSYNYSFAEPNERNFHLAEVRFERGRTEQRHGAFGIFSFGTDVGLNTRKFLLGPRAGVLTGFMGLCFGADLAYYTDFSQGTLRLVPIMGIGSAKVRLTINPHVRLTNKTFEPIDRGHVSLTVRLRSWKR